jgi:hypothetical protein
MWFYFLSDALCFSCLLGGTSPERERERERERESERYE